MAVFGVELGPRVKLPKAACDGVADYLATRLTESGRYQVVPRDQLRQRLVQEKKKSYKECFDQTCQIEIGKELAAEKTLSTKVIRLGKRCTVTLTLYDLRKAATEAAASQHGSCGEDEVIGSLDKALDKLFGENEATRRKAALEKEARRIASEEEARRKTALEKEARRNAVLAEEARRKAAEPAGGIQWVRSRPAGIEFTKTEITVAQYRGCVNAGNCTAPKTNSANGRCNWDAAGRDQHPVNCVSFDQAREFCAWAQARLPTADEWFLEASDNSRRTFPWGNTNPSCDFAVKYESSTGKNGCGRGSTWPACSKPEGNSVSGLCDMSGNLWEWAQDGTVRGGSYTGAYPNPPYGSNNAISAATHEGYALSSQNDTVGFRCAR